MARLTTADPMPARYPGNNKSLSFMHVNVNSIVAGSKLDEISALVSEFRLDIIAVTESWLDDSIESHEISLAGFQLPFRRDRNRHGGGVLI